MSGRCAMDVVFIVGVGLVVIAAEWLYSLSGWPMPGLVAK
jgi:hypothetical protein